LPAGFDANAALPPVTSTRTGTFSWAAAVAVQTRLCTAMRCWSALRPVAPAWLSTMPIWVSATVTIAVVPAVQGCWYP